MKAHGMGSVNWRFTCSPPQVNDRRGRRDTLRFSRPTRADVAAGSAVFVLQDAGKPIGHAINISVPQYGFHIDADSGKSEPCIIIQAEEARGYRLIGAYTLPERKLYAGFFNEFQLLGTHMPAR